jgi:hypothetical protein
LPLQEISKKHAKCLISLTAKIKNRANSQFGVELGSTTPTLGSNLALFENCNR